MWPMLVRGDVSQQPARNDQAFTNLKGKRLGYSGCHRAFDSSLLRQSRQPRALGNRNAQ